MLNTITTNMSFVLERLPGDVLRCRKKCIFLKTVKCTHYPQVYMKSPFSHGMSYKHKEQI